MAIKETKLQVRPNASTPFFDESDNAVLAAIRTARQSMIDSGKFTVEVALSDDQLAKTTTCTFADLDTLSANDTLLSVELDNAYLNYANDNSFDLFLTTDTRDGSFYKLEGIDQPFKVTTVYTFPPKEEDHIYSNVTSFGGILEQYQHWGKNIDLVVGENTVTVVHQYDNSADYTAKHFSDLTQYVPQLAFWQATRTIKFELV